MVNNYFVLFQSLFSEELRITEELGAQIILCRGASTRVSALSH